MLSILKVRGYNPNPIITVMCINASSAGDEGRVGGKAKTEAACDSNYSEWTHCK